MEVGGKYMAIESIVLISKQEWLNNYCLRVEELGKKDASEVLRIFDRLVCGDAVADEWKLYYLSNGGIYMAPATTSSDAVIVMSSLNSGKRTVSPEAAGIVASLRLFRCWSPRLYRLLGVYAMEHLK